MTEIGLKVTSKKDKRNNSYLQAGFILLIVGSVLIVLLLRYVDAACFSLCNQCFLVPEMFMPRV